MKKIIFEAAEPYVDILLEKPEPSTNKVPKWYRDQKLFSNKESDYFKAFQKNDNVSLTYKLCVPLMDTLTTGYTLVNSADIFVKNVSTDITKYEPLIKWGTAFSPLDSQLPEMLGNYPVPTGYSSISFRWNNDWKITTPSGYSLLLMHPSQRHDLPFFTLTAIVDTDRFPNKIHLPFFIKDGFEGIIEAGTPIAQIIPIKRDVWKSEKKSFQEKTHILYKSAMQINFIRAYKNKIWSRKVYK
jgi:hypothetical protein